MTRIIIAITISLACTGCVDWKTLNPFREAVPKAQAFGGTAHTDAKKDCVGAFPNSSVGTFSVKTNFPFKPDCSYIFQYPDSDVAVGVLETLGAEQIIWFRFKQKLPKDSTYDVRGGFADERNISVSLDHPEFNLFKEYPNGDPLLGTLSFKRINDEIQVAFDLSTSIKLKDGKTLEARGSITVPNTIETTSKLSH